jgi:hypothetical protein
VHFFSKWLFVAPSTWAISAPVCHCANNWRSFATIFSADCLLRGMPPLLQIEEPREWSRWNVGDCASVAGEAGRRSEAGHAVKAGTKTSGLAHRPDLAWRRFPPACTSSSAYRPSLMQKDILQVEPLQRGWLATVARCVLFDGGFLFRSERRNWSNFGR